MTVNGVQLITWLVTCYPWREVLGGMASKAILVLVPSTAEGLLPIFL